MHQVFPKIELHCHLDGSLRPETIMDLAKQYQIVHPHKNMESLTQALVAPSDCDSLDTYLERFVLPIQVLQYRETLTRAAYEVMEDAAKENVKYIEIRFAPQLHVQKGLKLDEIIQSVIDGIRLAEVNYEIRGNVILSYLRNTAVSGLYDVIEAGRAYLDKGVVAVDLCGGERDRFAERFKAPILYAKELGYHVTIHAGETGITQNIVDAINLLKAERIGHGVAMINDPEVFKYVNENGIAVECCPTSNVQTKAVRHIVEHPIDLFYKRGIVLSVNTDNRTVSNTSMSDEFEVLANTFEWEKAHWDTIFEMSISASFANQDTKDWLKKIIKNK